MRFPLVWCGVVASLGLVTACRTTRPPEVVVGPQLRLLTYNVNWGGPRPDLAIEIIQRSGADIVCLQETPPQWEGLIRQALAGEYRFAEFRSSGRRSGGGLAFLAKTPGTEVAYIPSDIGWFDGWVMAFDTAIGPVQILNVHLHPPVSESGSVVVGYLTTRTDRLHEMERFFSARRPELPTLVAGDFNDTEHSRVLAWLKERDMVNALPEFDRSTATWEWSYGVLTLKRRMDHIVYSSDLHCCSARVIHAGASDHFPVEAVFTALRPAN